MPPPPYARQKPESVVSDATTTTALLHHNRPTNKAPQHQRPITPEIKAPVVLLGRSAGLLHSPSPSLLRKINNKTTSLRDSYLDPASPAQRTIASSTSSSTRTSSSTSITKQRPRTSTSTSGTLSSSNKSDSSRVVQRSLVRKRPWEKNWPQLKNLQREVDSLLILEKNQLNVLLHLLAL